MTQPIALTATETAGALSVSIRTLNSWKRTGVLVPAKINGCLRYPVADIRRMLEKHQDRSVEEATVAAAG